ncbi:hypothetical protein D3C73_667760 [compost metagenome]
MHWNELSVHRVVWGIVLHYIHVEGHSDLGSVEAAGHPALAKSVGPDAYAPYASEGS